MKQAFSRTIAALSFRISAFLLYNMAEINSSFVPDLFFNEKRNIALASNRLLQESRLGKLLAKHLIYVCGKLFERITSAIRPERRTWIQHEWWFSRECYNETVGNEMLHSYWNILNVWTECFRNEANFVLNCANFVKPCISVLWFAISPKWYTNYLRRDKKNFG